MPRIKIVFSTAFLAACMTLLSVPATAQQSLTFPMASASDLGSGSGNTGDVYNGMAAIVFNGNLYSAFTASGPYTACPGGLAVQGYYDQGTGYPNWTQVYPSGGYCNLPLMDGQPQMTVWNGKIYIAYAESGDDLLVVASSSDGSNFTYVKPGIQVYPGPAIAPFQGELYIAYQQHDSTTHYLGIATSADGVTFTNDVHTDIRIGHSPAIVQYGTSLVVANFCQCSGHYLDVYTSPDGLTFYKTEITSQTLSNLSAPSLAVSNGILVLAYVRNGTNDIYTSTSYDAVNWTAAVRQSNNLSFSLGGSALAVNPDGSIYIVYESERALSWDPYSGAHQEFYSLAPML